MTANPTATTTTSLARHIACDAAFNVRDLGGYRAGDGRAVRWRRVFRADGLHRIGPDDRTLDGLEWRTVIDLRTIAEVDAGRYERPGVEVVHVPVLRETWDESTLEAESDEPVEYLAARYVEMSEAGAEAIAAVLELLAHPSRLPAVFHCSAGKDRTGVVAALLLAALGVDDEQIADDYHLSAQAMDQLVPWITAHRPEVAEHMARQPSALLACPRDAIGVFLARLRRRHGSVAGYLTDIGVDTATLDALRGNLLL
jgi:protein tyrosine/serine phosphatase